MHAETFRTLRADVYAALRPPPQLDLADWTEKHVRIPQTVSAEPGRMVLMPWQREVARSIGNNRVGRVSILKSSRIGATQLMVAGLAHYALNDPALQLVVLPSESLCRMLLTDMIEPTFNASPALRGALTENVSGRDTMLTRHYAGGRLSIVSGASGKNLRARAARVLWMDEVDGLEVSAGGDDGEGDPVAIALRRVASFGSRSKVVMASTPIDEATSRIARAYEEGDCRQWHLPCLHCGTYQELEWSMIQWPTGKPEEAYFCCPACGAITQEADRPKMLDRGKWVVTRPEVIGHHSYRINAIGGSALESWGSIAAQFVAAKTNPNLLKVWTNQLEGRVWRDGSDGLEPGDLIDTVEPIGLDGRIPPEVIILTAGTDLQADRAEISTLGWTADGRALVLEHSVIWGDPYGDDLWRDVHDLLARSFPHPNGGTLRYDAALTDAGFATQEVYNATRGYAAKRIFPCMGVSGWKRPPVSLGKAAGDKTIRLQLVGTDPIKQRIMGMVQGGSFRFSDSLSEEWFDGFTAERLRTRFNKGFKVLEWHKVRQRNEPIDTCTYAVAARSLLNIDLDRRAEELASQAAPAPAPRRIKSRWMQGG
ncbi:phage terminase large subunit family protein [Paracoccus methylarcula]|uniref:Terminase n=1 Tax=Paracoccus methylarcula TaxID=72022 RepID=A0A422QUQ0_9RHOB|nr:terminase gpA endonuclease subunit [Paracoccus methylarcula]RNF33710.1 terminase [Paracoccus methylarcula]